MSKQKHTEGQGTETGRNSISVKAPFKIENDEKRRFIRLEILDPLSYSVLKDRASGFWPDGDGPVFTGSILNISAGGVLIVSKAALSEGTLVIIKMTLQGVEAVNNVIGIVKRAEQDEDEWLVGIEFITRKALTDHLSSAEYDLVPENIASFNEHVQNILNKYVNRQRVSRGDG